MISHTDSNRARPGDPTGGIVRPARSCRVTQHDAIVARGSGNMTITIPRGTAMVMAHLRAGHLSHQQLHGVFIAHVRAAGISLKNVSGTGYVESLRGRIVATNSTFERLRVRTATGNMLFQGCTSHQIQASSAYGSIVYDNGNFAPGLARFESEHGNVALGVRGNAQIGAHSGAGHVVSSFDGRRRSSRRPDDETGDGRQRRPGRDRNLEERNSVYLYSGSMNEHPHVRAELSGSTQLPMQLRNPAAAHPPVNRPPPQPRFPSLKACRRRPQSRAGQARLRSGAPARRIGFEHLRPEVLKDRDFRPHLGHDAAGVGPGEVIDVQVVAIAQDVDDEHVGAMARVVGRQAPQSTCRREHMRRAFPRGLKCRPVGLHGVDVSHRGNELDLADAIRSAAWLEHLDPVDEAARRTATRPARRRMRRAARARAAAAESAGGHRLDQYVDVAGMIEMFVREHDRVELTRIAGRHVRERAHERARARDQRESASRRIASTSRPRRATGARRRSARRRFRERGSRRSIFES